MDSAPGIWPYDQIQDYSLSQIHSRRWENKDILFERKHERRRPVIGRRGNGYKH